jgi:hypothetical protein
MLVKRKVSDQSLEPLVLLLNLLVGKTLLFHRSLSVVGDLKIANSNSPGVSRFRGTDPLARRAVEAACNYRRSQNSLRVIPDST